MARGTRLRGYDNYVNSSTDAPPRPKMPENLHQLAFYEIESSKKHHYVDTNCLCVDTDINMPNPTSIDRMAVPP